MKILSIPAVRDFVRFFALLGAREFERVSVEITVVRISTPGVSANLGRFESLNRKIYFCIQRHEFRRMAEEAPTT